ncbi:MAG: YitT family protein [Flavobacteriales bacterium]
MKAFLERLVLRTMLRGDVAAKGEEEISPFALAKGYRALRVLAWRTTKDIAMLVTGVASAAFGLESFLLPNTFIDGGATGIALLITAYSGLPLGVWLALVNVPFILMAYRMLGKEFAMKTVAGIVALALAVSLVHFPQVTHDKLLVAVFGGFFLGLGIGLAVRAGAVIDGTEVLAIAISRRTGLTIGDVILFVNVIIFGVAAWLLTVEIALYSMITYLAAGRTVDFIIEGIEEYTGVTIISPHSDELRDMIVHKLRRGITVYNGKRGYGTHGHAHDTEILYCVITRLEVGKLTAEIRRIDPNAFVIMSSIKDTRGGMIKQRRHKH